MSHLPERKEKVCLNCGAAIHGRFCHICGQENIELKENFWHLLTHFVYDITHFDGKFFSTLRYLLFRPGYLSHEYLKGRRADYLHPIRMYVFTSAFFFLIFFTVNKENDTVKVNVTKSSAASLVKKLEKNRADIVKTLQDTGMPVIAKNILEKQLAGIDSDMALITRDTTARDKLKTLGNEELPVFSGSKEDSVYKNVQIYDSIQRKLSVSQKDNFFERRFALQRIHLKEKYNDDSKAIWTAILKKLQHLFSQLLFVSLPLFALILQLLYMRKRNFYYVNHVVYAIHLYCATFIIILAGMGAEGVFSVSHLKEPGWLQSLFVLAGFFYWYKSMRNFYEQHRGKTILKYCLVLLLSLMMMGLLFGVFFIFSAMSI